MTDHTPISGHDKDWKDGEEAGRICAHYSTAVEAIKVLNCKEAKFRPVNAMFAALGGCHLEQARDLLSSVEIEDHSPEQADCIRHTALQALHQKKEYFAEKMAVIEGRNENKN